MEKEEIIKKCKLTEKELEEFMEFIENKDPKKDHSRAYRTLMNPTRRKIMKTIGYEVKTTEEISEELGIESNQLEYHFSMLEQLRCILRSEEGWKSTPRGLGFLENASMMF
ncbi:MAG: helix-turn-helix domain-containing protein [Candidatus Lokiarchaeota archaeon]|nr:helix-turn-helix domain-containing protein [Candidatus Lokiarchaeota archaeon]MBD3202417.1 helix-turn-helix domain-containing protein [Candidatus Lokiarchaeota archaeon]